MKTKLSQGFTLIELLVVITIIAILAGIAMPAISMVQEQARITEAGNNARQIVFALKAYAGDHGGNYPDAEKQDPPQTSNDAFRMLFQRGLLHDERIFAAATSPYAVDQNIGEAPGFEEAVKAGENHWAMTKGLTDSASGNAPLVFENPVSGGSWPPVWNCNAAGQRVAGRAWKSAKIVVGRNDGSVAPEALETITGDSVGLKTNSNGKDLFTQFSEQGEFLDVARE